MGSSDDDDEMEAQIAAAFSNALAADTSQRPTTIREDLAAQGRTLADYLMPQPYPLGDYQPVRVGIVFADHPASNTLTSLITYLLDREALHMVGGGFPRGVSSLGRRKDPLDEQGVLLAHSLLDRADAMLDDADLFERMRRLDLARAARRRRKDKNRQDDFATAEFLEDQGGGVHFRPIDLSWRPGRLLCGPVFEEDTGFLSEGVRLAVAGRRTVTCPDCARLLSALRKVRMDPTVDWGPSPHDD